MNLLLEVFFRWGFEFEVRLIVFIIFVIQSLQFLSISFHHSLHLFRFIHLGFEYIIIIFYFIYWVLVPIDKLIKNCFIFTTWDVGVNLTLILFFHHQIVNAWDLLLTLQFYFLARNRPETQFHITSRSTSFLIFSRNIVWGGYFSCKPSLISLLTQKRGRSLLSMC